jgi:hypothetical protein
VFLETRRWRIPTTACHTCSLEIDCAVILPAFGNCSTKANSVTAVDIELDAVPWAVKIESTLSDSPQSFGRAGDLSSLPRCSLGAAWQPIMCGSFSHLETRRVTLAGITQHPTEEWMVQMARRAVDDIDATLLPIRFILHDRDSKFCASFQGTLRSAGIQPLSLPARSPNL